MSAVAVEVPYGCAVNPLGSIDERCPECRCRLVASLADPDLLQVRLATVSLSPADLAHWRSICRVDCSSCSWVGSAYRPGHPIRRSR